ncbi:MAG: serine hydrolase, partial [Candidatus Fimadaptatus sp.]
MPKRLMPVLSVLLLAAMLAMVGANGAIVSARAGEAGESLPLEDSVPFALASKSALLVEASTGRVIYQKNASERRPVASVTKLMPILLILEAIEDGRCALDDDVTASARAGSMGGSQALLDAGSTYKL